MTLQLHRDGVLEDLFYFLWLSNFQTGQKLLLNMPDTVIYRFGSMASYYFSSKLTREVLKQKEVSLRDEDLALKRFTKNVPKSGICAYFIKEKPRVLKETKYNREISELTAGQFKYENM